MDSISIVIIVTVLSLGSALVYIFKSDFEKRKRSLLSHHSNSNKTAIVNQSRKHPQHSKLQQARLQSNQKPATLPSKQQNVPHHQQQPDSTKSASISGKQPASQKPRKASTSSLASQQQQPEVRPSPSDSARGLEPSMDELDSSILLEVFDPTQNIDRAAAEQQQSAKHQENLVLATQQQQHSKSTKNRSAKKNSIIARADLLNDTNDYSSDQLFKIIAACNLSKEEIELAVETLLNKIELGETTASSTATNATTTTNDAGSDGWKQPKNDPLQRLRNQLKDTETALSIEIQNHELTRARLCELKNALQLEKSSSGSNKEELSKLKKELDIVNVALEQSRLDLTKQQAIIQKQLKEENIKLLNKLDQQQLQVQNFINQLAGKDNELLGLKRDLDEKCKLLSLAEDKTGQLEKLAKELELKLSQQENHVGQLKKLKQQEEYELLTKLNDVESDKLRLEKILKDRVENLNETLATNNLLEKSVKELQLINARQEDMLTRLRDERHLDEESMKRTLTEMDSELKELQNKLLLKGESKQQDQQMNGNGDRQKDRLMLELRQLREGLASLIPELKDKVELSLADDGSSDWVQQYLSAIKQLGKTVDELKSQTSLDTGNVSLSSTSPSPTSSPSKKSTNGFRVKSPASPSGRRSRNSDGDKKVIETKLLEVSDNKKRCNQYNSKLDSNQCARSNNPVEPPVLPPH